MHPLLFELGPLRVGSYGLFFVFAILTGWIVFRTALRQLHPKVPADDYYFIFVFSGFIGAKLFNLLVNLPAVFAGKMSWVGVLMGGGHWLGGVVPAGLVCFYLQRRFKIPSWTGVDIGFMALPGAHAVGRIGCILGGCCYGLPTDLPWAITFTNPLAAQYNHTPLNVPLHPVQIYESILEFINFGVAIWLWRRKAPPWTITAYWVGVYGVERFILERFRNDPRGSFFLGLSPSQCISVGMVALSIALVVMIRRRARR